jgi:DNA-binding response OmpR family regulator
MAPRHGPSSSFPLPAIIMPRLLLIDDDATLRRAMRIFLEKSGFEIVEASDGRAGLAAFAAQPAALVVTDLIMPEVEGVETIRALRKLSGTVPIIAISGRGSGGSADYLDDVRVLGASEVFEKPFELRALQAAIVRLLGPPKASGPV